MNNRDAITRALEAIEDSKTVKVVRQKATPTKPDNPAYVADAEAWNVLYALRKII